VAARSGKAGVLDDPIWSSVPNDSDPARHTQIHQRRWPYVIVGFLVAAFIGLVVSLALGSGHPGGDPGGVIAAEVRAAANGAVPHGSQIVGRRVSDSEFGACGYSNPGSGWSTVTGGVSFKTSLADSQVISAAASTLRSDGWTKMAESSSSASWTRTLASGSVAKLRLIKGYLVPDGWTAWIDAQPQGANCGGNSAL
jgi:hypothetical protein